MNCMRFSSMGTGWPFNIFAFREADDTVTPSANTMDRHWSRIGLQKTDLMPS